MKKEPHEKSHLCYCDLYYVLGQTPFAMAIAGGFRNFTGLVHGKVLLIECSSTFTGDSKFWFSNLVLCNFVLQ